MFSESDTVKFFAEMSDADYQDVRKGKLDAAEARGGLTHFIYSQPANNPQESMKLFHCLQSPEAKADLATAASNHHGGHLSNEDFKAFLMVLEKDSRRHLAPSVFSIFAQARNITEEQIIAKLTSPKA